MFIMHILLVHLEKKCLIITADGDGDYGINATYSISKNNKIKEIFRTANQPIAKLWRYFTLMLGMKPQQHEYKVMGLAPYASEYLTKKFIVFYQNITMSKA